MNRYEDAVAKAVGHVPAATLTALADALTDGEALSAPWAGPAADRVAAIITSAAGYPPGLGAAAAYLRGATAGYKQGAGEQSVEIVWGGPTVHAVPTRSMSQTLADLIGRARTSLLLMTYSAKPHPPVITAISTALARDVSVSIVVETLGAAGSAISGDEPAAAFLGLPGVDLWHWPKGLRNSPNAKMHAKIAVADDRELLVGSANLTASGVDHSMESALLVTGGQVARRARQHIEGLIALGQICRLQ